MGGRRREGRREWGAGGRRAARPPPHRTPGGRQAAPVVRAQMPTRPPRRRGWDASAAATARGAHAVVNRPSAPAAAADGSLALPGAWREGRQGGGACGHAGRGGASGGPPPSSSCSSPRSALLPSSRSSSLRGRGAGLSPSARPPCAGRAVSSRLTAVGFLALFCFGALLFWRCCFGLVARFAVVFFSPPLLYRLLFAVSPPAPHPICMACALHLLLPFPTATLLFPLFPFVPGYGVGLSRRCGRSRATGSLKTARAAGPCMASTSRMSRTSSSTRAGGWCRWSSADPTPATASL